jgi:Protein of unknown function (DUF2958)
MSARQKMLLDAQRRAMLNNGQWNRRAAGAADFRPVVKLFCPWGGATWLLTELDPDDPDSAFGLCDLGQGFPELGRVSLAELAAIRGPGGLYIERDIGFRPTCGLSAYVTAARRARRIIA